MIDRTILSIGNFHLYWYSVLIASGIIIGLYLLIKEANKQNINKDIIIDIAFYTIIWGIIGARIYYVIFNYKPYITNLISILYIWEGGLAIYGAIIAGFIALIYQSKKKNIRLTKLADMIAPSLILAQAIGRWGNFFNQEAHGGVVSLEYLKKIHIPNFIINGMYINGNYYQPTFFYESLWCILGFILLLIIRKIYKNRKDGTLIYIYLIWYGIGRFFIEGLRTDSLYLGIFRISQIVSIVIIIIGIIGLIYNKRKEEK